jgi:hypothetical protein
LKTREFSNPTFGNAAAYSISHQQSAILSRRSIA